MTAIAICRTRAPLPSEEDMEKVRLFLFGCMAGAHEDDRKAWNRFWRRVLRLDAGEMMNFEVVFPRNPRFHRKFFALLNLGFEAWEPPRKRKTYKGIPVLKNFDKFRRDVTILAGYYVQTFGLDGRMELDAQSISFASMDDVEFEKLYSAVADVLLARVFSTYAGREELDEIVDRIVGFL